MEETIKERLYRVTEDVLEKLAFIFSYPEDERDGIDQGTAVLASVSFDGSFSGTLLTFVTESILPELAANMLGVENDETTREQQFDALKELQNIICGNLLPAIAGKQVVFNVSTPRIADSFQEETAGKISLCSARLSLEEGECDLYLYVDEELPANIVIADTGEENKELW